MNKKIDKRNSLDNSAIIKQFLRATAAPEVLLRARISYGDSVCPSVRPSACPDPVRIQGQVR